MAGRKQIPTKVKKLQGTFRKDRSLKDEALPDQPSTMPPCPKNFDKAAKDEWFKTTAQLQKWGILGECDMSLLEIYVYNISLSKKAIDMLEKEGHVLRSINKTGAEYVAKNPWMDVFKLSVDFSQKLGTLFGFNPSARTKISKPEKPKEDDFEKLNSRASA